MKNIHIWKGKNFFNNNSVYFILPRTIFGIVKPEIHTFEMFFPFTETEKNNNRKNEFKLVLGMSSGTKLFKLAAVFVWNGWQSQNLKSHDSFPPLLSTHTLFETVRCTWNLQNLNKSLTARSPVEIKCCRNSNALCKRAYFTGIYSVDFVVVIQQHSFRYLCTRLWCENFW